jgi:murein DD-endopeptidase MepM/ murein hydrolase activator NlpD
LTQRAGEVATLVAAAALAAGAAVGVARQHGLLGGLRTAPALVVTGPPVETIADTLRRRETVSQLFQRRGVTDVDWPSVAQAVRNFQPSRLKAGLVFLFSRRRGAAAPHAVAARTSRDERLLLTRVADHWSASVERIPWHAEPLVVSGSITRDAATVYDAMDNAVSDALLSRDERTQLVLALADVYDWEVDFARDLQPGDGFRVVAERLVSADGEARFGRVAAARLDLGGRRLYAFRLDEGDRPAFWDENGRSLRRDFLRSPLRYRSVTSRFSGSRWQPILHYYRAHLGTDFAAELGTEVRAIGAGTVIFAGREGDYGNLVEIRHPRGFETRYGHLLRFAEGIQTGVRVEQNQVVGFVGSSGLSTGPHLHFEVRQNGRAVNPLRQLGGAAPGAPIAADLRPAFEREKQRLQQLLEPPPPVVIASTPRT